MEMDTIWLQFSKDGMEDEGFTCFRGKGIQHNNFKRISEAAIQEIWKNKVGIQKDKKRKLIDTGFYFWFCS